MASALTGPFLAAALVLCIAGLAKLRSPTAAAGALTAIGLPGRAMLVRAFATGELALGAACALSPSAATATTATCVYAAFAGISLVLARHRKACGCFGEHDAPATVAQSVLSGLLALLAVTAALFPPHGLGWLLARSPQYAAVFALGTGGLAYAIVLVYTELPQAWRAWSSAS